MKYEICARRMSNPGKCAWVAPDVILSNAFYTSRYMDTSYVFGDGQWVTTGDGVRDLVSGQKANFGKDAGTHSSIVTSYTGSAGRVFKVINAFAQSDRMTFQPWDTDTDTAVSPEISARNVGADPGSPVYLALDADSSRDSTTITAYDWATGEQKWQKPYLSVYAPPGLLIGGSWVSDSDGTLTAYDELTGDVTWHDSAMNSILGVRDGLIYASTYSQLKVVDPANGFAVVQQAPLPQEANSLALLPHAVCAVDYDSNLYVLHG